MFHKYKTHCFVITVIVIILLLFCIYFNDNDIETGSQAYAYLEIIKELAEEHLEATKSIDEEVKLEYIAVNLKGVLYKRPSHIKKLIEDYTEEYGVQIVWTNKNRYDSPKVGFLLIFEDIEITEAKLKTDVTLWGSDANAFCERFTIENEAEKWMISEVKGIWIT